MNSLNLVFWVASVWPMAAQEAPWNKDVAATRQAALREKSACVVLINSDAEAF